MQNAPVSHPTRIIIFYDNILIIKILALTMQKRLDKINISAEIHCMAAKEKVELFARTCKW